MLWCSENNVSNFNDIIHHKNIIQKLNNLEYLQNMLFYGPNGSGKLTIIKLFLKKILEIPDNLDILRKLEIPITTTKNLIIYENNYYYYIDMTLINDKKKILFLFDNFIQGVIKSKNILSKQHVFFINNIQNNNEDLNRYLKKFIRNYNLNSKFILCSHHNISNNFKFNCFFMTIKISKITLPTIKLILQSILQQKIKDKIIKKTKINKQTYQTIIMKSNLNLSKSISLLQLKINNTYEFKQYLKREDNYFVPLLKLMMKKPHVSIIDPIRNFIYDYFTKFTNENLITSFTNYLLDLPNTTISNEQKYKISFISANLNEKINKITKDIICFELFLIKVNMIFNNV